MNREVTSKVLKPVYIYSAMLHVSDFCVERHITTSEVPAVTVDVHCDIALIYVAFFCVTF